ALDAATSSDLVFITGGLGPTTDDFTREAISEWSGLSLEFRQQSWTKIQQRLTDRGISVAQSNRQQCFFPVGSTVFENSEGTADGFHLAVSSKSHARGSELLVLPGPPAEGKHLWESSIAAWLKG